MFANEDTGYLPYTYTTKIVDKHILANYLSIFVETYDNEDVLQHYVDKCLKKQRQIQEQFVGFGQNLSHLQSP